MNITRPGNATAMRRVRIRSQSKRLLRPVAKSPIENHRREAPCAPGPRSNGPARPDSLPPLLPQVLERRDGRDEGVPELVGLLLADPRDLEQLVARLRAPAAHAAQRLVRADHVGG